MRVGALLRANGDDAPRSPSVFRMGWSRFRRQREPGRAQRGRKAEGGTVAAGLEVREAPAGPLRRNDMPKAIQKITLDRSDDIPFDNLELSQKNVRNIKVGASIEDLANHIGLRGLLMSLNVRPILSENARQRGTTATQARSWSTAG